MTGRKKSVNRQKSGGRQKAGTKTKSGSRTNSKKRKSNARHADIRSLFITEAHAVAYLGGEAGSVEVPWIKAFDAGRYAEAASALEGYAESFDDPHVIREAQSIAKKVRGLEVDTEPISPQDTRVKKMRAELAKVPMGEMFGVQKFMEKYATRADRELYFTGQDEYQKDARIRHLANGDVTALQQYQWSHGDEYDSIKEKHGIGRSRARDELEARIIKRWLEMQEPRWNKHRLVWFAEELTNQNQHVMSSYVAYVEIYSIPEEIWVEAESRGDF